MFDVVCKLTCFVTLRSQIASDIAFENLDVKPDVDSWILETHV